MKIGDRVKVLESHKYIGRVGVIIARYKPDTFGDEEKVWTIRIQGCKDTNHFEEFLRLNQIDDWKKRLRR